MNKEHWWSENQWETEVVEGKSVAMKLCSPYIPRKSTLGTHPRLCDEKLMGYPPAIWHGFACH
jgi:hypothetical protein